MSKHPSDPGIPTDSRFFSIKEKIHAPDRVSGFDSHATFELVLVLGGHGYYETVRDGLVKKTIVKEGTLVFRDAKDPHRSVDDLKSPLHQIVCMFDYGFLKGLAIEEEIKRRLDTQNPMVFFNPFFVFEIKTLLRRLLSESEKKDFAKADAVFSALISVFVNISRTFSEKTKPEGVTDERIQRVLHSLQDVGSEYSVAHYADQVGLSTRHFSELFKKETGQNFVRYLQNRRVTVAKDLLSTTEKRVTTISFESGFDNLSHFNKTFKRLTGMTPLSFRLKSQPPKFRRDVKRANSEAEKG